MTKSIVEEITDWCEHWQDNTSAPNPQYRIELYDMLGTYRVEFTAQLSEWHVEHRIARFVGRSSLTQMITPVSNLDSFFGTATHALEESFRNQAA